MSKTTNKTTTAKNATENEMKKPSYVSYNITEQHRASWGLANLWKLACDALLGRWAKGSPLIVYGKGKANVADTMLEIPEFPTDKTIEIGDYKYSKSELIDLVRDYESHIKGDCLSVCAGRHRALALTIARAVALDKGIDIEIHETIEQAESKGDAALQDALSNEGHDKVTKLSNLDRLRYVLSLIKESIIQQQSDLSKVLGYNRHKVQTLWHQAKLVNECSLSEEQASKVDYKTYGALEAAVKAENDGVCTTADLTTAVKAFLNGEASKPKSMLGRKAIEKRLSEALTGSHGHAMLTAILEGNDVALGMAITIANAAYKASRKPEGKPEGKATK